MKRKIYLLLFALLSMLSLDSQVYIVQDVSIASGTEVYVKDTIIIENDNIKVEGTLASSIVHSNPKIEKSSPCPVLENQDEIFYSEVPKEEIEFTYYTESPKVKKDHKSTKKLIENSKDTPVLTEANPAISIPFPLGSDNEKLFSERDGLFIEHKKLVKEYGVAPLEINLVNYFSEVVLEPYIGYKIDGNTYKIVTDESKRGPPRS